VPRRVRLAVIVVVAEDAFGVEEEGGHFPDGELEVHLREFEGTFQYPGESERGATVGWVGG
jgi:hypothetical protein